MIIGPGVFYKDEQIKSFPEYWKNINNTSPFLIELLILYPNAEITIIDINDINAFIDNTIKKKEYYINVMKDCIYSDSINRYVTTLAKLKIDLFMK